jgi:redox-sensitive bicupin YhaK (pirin superfamily)
LHGTLTVEKFDPRREDDNPALLQRSSTRSSRMAVTFCRRSGGPNRFPKNNRSGRFVPLASGLAADAGALPVRADGRVLGATLKSGETVDYAAKPERPLYLVPSAGTIDVNGVGVEARDGVAIRQKPSLKITANQD